MKGVSQLIPLLPDGYADLCRTLRVIERKRGFESAEDLMLMHLYHLVQGCTLLEVSEIARLTKIADVSDVAYMIKFAKSGEWFEQITKKLSPKLFVEYEKPEYVGGRRVLAFDASDVVEKGRSARTYRLHYGIDLFTLSSVSYKITGQEIGEKLNNFEIHENDIVIADRAYGTINSIKYCKEQGADCILRLRANCFAIYDKEGNEIDILSQLQTLEYEQCTDFKGYIHTSPTERILVRICAKKKDAESCEQTKARLKRRESKKQHILSDRTRDFNMYIVTITTLMEPDAVKILETYRYRWQIENYFKRLKSIMGFGELPKKQETSSKAWLNGKIMVALLIELLLAKHSFPPNEKYET